MQVTLEMVVSGVVGLMAGIYAGNVVLVKEPPTEFEICIKHEQKQLQNEHVDFSMALMVYEEQLAAGKDVELPRKPSGPRTYEYVVSLCEQYRVKQKQEPLSNGREENLARAQNTNQEEDNPKAPAGW